MEHTSIKKKIMGLKTYVTFLSFMWIGSIVSSIGFTVAIIILWHKAFIGIEIKQEPFIEKSSFNTEQILNLINNTKSPSALQDVQQKKSESTNYLFLPTGIYIRQLTINTYTASFVGYVWQKYPIAHAHTIKTGVFFPQATISTMEKVYEFTDAHWKTIGWSVHCTLQQYFNFHSYPFDTQKITLEIWPDSFDKNIILVPDFDSYASFAPHQLPGIANTVHTQSWRIEKSYFTYEKESMLTDFGYAKDMHNNAKKTRTQRSLPELQFNIIANRSLSGSLIVNILPIIILLVLLFIVLIMTQFVEFYPIFGSLSFLFFISIVAYITFKSLFTAQQISFFDYMYFTVQGIILIIAMFTIIYYRKSNINWVRKNHMLIPRLLFWPVATGAILIISLIFFY